MAAEGYLLHRAWKSLEPLLSELCLAKDAALNAQVRRLCRTLSSAAGVPRDFIDRIPRARRELAHLERLTTPRAKNLCLRKLTRHLASEALSEGAEEGRREFDAGKMSIFNSIGCSDKTDGLFRKAFVPRVEGFYR